MPDVVLASSSPYRRELLERLGVEFEVVEPEVDEDAIRAETKDPIGLARALATAKAEAVAKKHGKSVVVGADQVCALDGEILAKPGSKEVAAEQLAKLSGKEHALITAVALRKGKTATDFVDVAMLRMRKLDKKEIERYLALDEPFDCAGAYKIERGGIALFERLQCEDHTAIIGLPMLALCSALRELGIKLP